MNGGTTNEYNEDDIETANTLASLPRVAAPGDFEARFRARMAGSRPKKRLWLLPTFAAASVVIFLGLVLFNWLPMSSNGVGDQAASTEVSGSTDSNQQEIVPVEEPPFAPPEQVVATSNSKEIEILPSVKNANDRPQKDSATKASDAPGGGSADFAASPERKVTSPKGFPLPTRPNAVPGATPKLSNNVSVSSVLANFGISAQYRDGNWVVTNVTNSGISEIKTGDVIEAIGSQAVSGKAEIDGRSIGSTLRYRRGGEIKTVPLSGRSN